MLSKMTWGIWQIFNKALNIDTKIEGKLTCAFKNDMWNLTDFQQSTRKSQNWDFDRILLSEVENIWVMCHDNEKWYKIWRGIDLSVQNWHEEFHELWPEHSKISKLCTLMGCFWLEYIIAESEKYRRVMLDGTKN